MADLGFSLTLDKTKAAGRCDTTATSKEYSPIFSRSVNGGNIPQELRELPRWVVWRAEQRLGKGKPTKVPYCATAINSKASSTDPATWATFDQATAAFEEEGSDYAGVGFVLNGDGVAGVDLDGCVHDGVPEPRALALLDTLDARYVELSPSGKGLRAFGYAQALQSGTSGLYDGIKTELYTSGRYLTLTGNTLRSGPLKTLRGLAEMAQSMRGTKSGADQSAAEVIKVDDATVRDLRSALNHIPADDRGVWVAVGHALKELGSTGRGLWLDWSQTSDKYDPAEDAKKWASFEPKSTGYRAVFTHAQRAGWVNPARGEPNRPRSAGFEPLEGAPRFTLLDAADLGAMPPIEWRIKGVLPARGMAQIYGPSKAGKSFLTLDMACAIAEGREEWFGYRVKAAPVVYVVLEGEAGFKLRAEAWKRHNGRELPENLFFVMQPFRVNDPQDIADLSSVVPHGAVVIIDTLSRAAPGADENSSKDMGLILEGAHDLQSRCNGLVILVAHTGKDATKGVRGHSSQIAAMDAALEVSRNGERRGWRAEKVKDGADGAAHGFRLVSLTLGTDEDGDAVTSAAIEPDDSPSRPTQKRTTEAQNQGIASYCIACEAGEGLLDEAGDFIGLHLEAWREYFYQISTADSQDAKKKAFLRSRKELQKDGLATVNDDVYRISEPSTSVRERLFKDAAANRATGQQRANNGPWPGQ